MKFVLKNSRQSLFKDFIFQDVKTIFNHLKSDFRKLLKERSGTPSLSSIKDSTIETAHVLKAIPGRMKKGFQFFKEDFIEELDQLEDPKDKAIFCMKVIGALTSFAVEIVYDLRRSAHMIYIPGATKKTAISEFFFTELVVQLSRLFVLRLIGEIEKHISGEDDLSNLKYFKHMLLVRPENENIEEWKTNDSEYGSFQLVENLRNYILTGKR